MLFGITIFFKFIVVPVLLFVLLLLGWVYWAPISGGHPDAASWRRIKSSPHFNGNVFLNLKPLMVTRKKGRVPLIVTFLNSLLAPPPGREPGEALPTEVVDKAAIVEGSITWLGHSTILLRTGGTTLLFDPVFHRASPLFCAGKPFAMTHPPQLTNLPEIDAVLISHDHYDHLDYHGIKELRHRVGHFYVPLGVKGHLQRWGVPSEKVTELDWYESVREGGVTLTLAPTRHFSGRGVTNRFTTLWGSWVVQSPRLSFYFSGDSGYNSEFAITGKKFGPFDFACIESGAYDSRWPQVHMQPEDSVRVALDVQAKVVLPIHWAKFDLAFHPWREPIQRFLAEARKKGVPVTTPRIGQTFTLDALPETQWWKDVK